jgi:hypothetical protein
LFGGEEECFVDAVVALVLPPDVDARVGKTSENGVPMTDFLSAVCL